MQPQPKYSTSAKLHSRTNKEGKRALYVTYTFAKETTPFPTAFSVADEHWDAKTKRAKVGTTDAQAINAKIEQVQTDLLAVAKKLAVPSHDMVKRLYNEQAYHKAKAELDKRLNHKVDFAIAIAEDGLIEQTENELTQAQQQLQARKKAFAATSAAVGYVSAVDHATSASQDELNALWRKFAGTGELLAAQREVVGKPRRDQGTLSHYKQATYNSMVSMWNIVHEFAAYTGYALSLDTINMDFYRQFGDFILFNRKVKDASGAWVDGELSFDNHFGSLIKRLKTFLNWAASDGGAKLNPEANSRKFKILEEENEVIILSDSVYQLLADFREDPACNPSWIKHIDVTLFQAHVGLRHSDLKKAAWRLEGKSWTGRTGARLWAPRRRTRAPTKYRSICSRNGRWAFWKSTISTSTKPLPSPRKKEPKT